MSTNEKPQPQIKKQLSLSHARMKKKFNISKPSYLITGISPHLMKDIDKVLLTRETERSQLSLSPESAKPNTNLLKKLNLNLSIKTPKLSLGSSINVHKKVLSMTNRNSGKKDFTSKSSYSFKNSLTEIEPRSRQMHNSNSFSSNTSYGFKSKEKVNSHKNNSQREKKKILNVKASGFTQKEIKEAKEKKEKKERTIKSPATSKPSRALSGNKKNKVLSPAKPNTSDIKKIFPLSTEKKKRSTLSKITKPNQNGLSLTTRNTYKGNYKTNHNSSLNSNTNLSSNTNYSLNNFNSPTMVKTIKRIPKSNKSLSDQKDASHRGKQKAKSISKPVKVPTRESSKTIANSKEVKSLNDLHTNVPPYTTLTPSNALTIKTTASSTQVKKIVKIESGSKAGYSQPNVPKVNQDNFFIEKNFLNNPEQFFVGVCDGHGLYGHLCSDFVSSNINEYISKVYKKSPSQSINKIVSSAFVSFDKELINDQEIDSNFSGTTCVSIIFLPEKMICANLGDSRAILARFEKGSYNTIKLSRDHKPIEQDECERILQSGGRVSPYFDEDNMEYIGPKRIWLKDSDIPGLAMTRSFGDQIAHSVGVTPEPEIKEFPYNGNEKFVVLASDGVWEFIDCDECIHIVKDYYENDMDASGAVNALISEAFKRWRREEDIVDDITAVVVFFE